MTTIADIRKDYKLKVLNESEVNSNPIIQFGIWWDDAIKSEITEVNAATLATSTKEGKPSARIILLKGYNENGFIFFTNYQSHKGQELAENTNAALVFFWKELERQVRIEGVTEKIPALDSDQYFASRPEGSRIGAWASPQSKVINDRNEIENNVIKLQEQYSDGVIPRPSHWGGYIIKPTLIEFWQGRPNRLHDRIQYTLQDNVHWKIERLAP